MTIGALSEENFPALYFRFPTPDNSTQTENASVEINVSISAESLDTLIWSWNTTNYTLLDDSVKLMFNFENRSGLGEDYNSVTDVATGINNGTAYGGADADSGYKTSGRHGGAWEFDGNGDYVQAAHHSSLVGMTELTLAAWVNPDGDGYSGWGRGIIFKGDSGGGNNINYQIGQNNNNRAMFEVRQSGSHLCWITSPNENLSQSTWSYVVGTYNSTDCLLYINGELVANTSATGTVTSATEPLYIGYSAPEGSNGYFNGKIDEPIVLNRSLTEEEIYQHYVSNLQKFNATLWHLYVNQSKDASSGLSPGNYTYYAYANDSDGENRTDERTVEITSGESAPEIYAVYNQTLAVDINENTFTDVIINFSVYDENGFSNLNDSSSAVNLSFPGEDLRQNISCYPYEQSGNYANYTCNVTMWWWDINDTWAINAYIEDNEGYSSINTSSVQEVGSTESFVISPSLLNWQALSPGAFNSTSVNDPMILNNTGNVPILNITVNSTNLKGEQDNSKALWAGNFTIGTSTGGFPPAECGGAGMVHGEFTQIESAILPRGNYTINDGTGQEELYFCLTIVGSDLTETQAYSTAEEGTWTVRIIQLLVALTLSRRRKKKKKYKVPVSIFTKELGGLEALTKYLRENLHLSYKEAAELINRDERTVWTAYSKAKEKLPEKLNDKSDTAISLSVFKSRLTPLAAAISHLKGEGLRNKEIAELINRDERNVWTIYNRIKDRVGEKPEKPKPEVKIPISIFKKELGGLEAVVKYMKENLDMKYSEIANLLNRDQRTVWTAYSKAVAKKPQKLRARGFTVPLAVFTEQATVLKAVIRHLRKRSMKYSEISKLIHRDERNVWTICNRKSR
jgi:predicted DNA-binding protein (UPF0251 family)